VGVANFYLDQSIGIDENNTGQSIGIGENNTYIIHTIYFLSSIKTVGVTVLVVCGR